MSLRATPQLGRQVADSGSGNVVHAVGRGNSLHSRITVGATTTTVEGGGVGPLSHGHRIGMFSPARSR